MLNGRYNKCSIRQDCFLTISRWESLEGGSSTLAMHYLKQPSVQLYDSIILAIETMRNNQKLHLTWPWERENCATMSNSTIHVMINSFQIDDSIKNEQSLQEGCSNTLISLWKVEYFVVSLATSRKAKQDDNYTVRKHCHKWYKGQYMMNRLHMWWIMNLLEHRSIQRLCSFSIRKYRFSCGWQSYGGRTFLSRLLFNTLLSPKYVAKLTISTRINW